MLDYNLVKKPNPMKKDDPKKWYAVPKCREAQDSKTMTRAATENTSTAPTEMAAVMELLGNYAAQQLVHQDNRTKSLIHIYLVLNELCVIVFRRGLRGLHGLMAAQLFNPRYPRNPRLKKVQRFTSFLIRFE